MGTPEGIGLDDALEALRADLASAQAKAAGKDLQFPIQTLTVELKVGVTWSSGGQGGISCPVRWSGVGRVGREWIARRCRP